MIFFIAGKFIATFIDTSNIYNVLQIIWIESKYNAQQKEFSFFHGDDNFDSF